MANVKKCPVCGVSVRLVNLEPHIERVHPGESVDVGLTAEEVIAARQARAPPPSGSSVARRGAVVLVALLVLAAAAVALYKPSPSSDGSRLADIQVSPSSWDFGNIPRSVVTHTFTVNSVGEDPLRITGLSTSCSCTSVTLYANGRESPRFGMHNNPTGWSETLSPGQTADLTVRYDPNLHPDTGAIYRIIYIRSNDRSNPEVEVEITANVVP